MSWGAVIGAVAQALGTGYQSKLDKDAQEDNRGSVSYTPDSTFPSYYASLLRNSPEAYRSSIQPLTTSSLYSGVFRDKLLGKDIRSIYDNGAIPTVDEIMASNPQNIKTDSSIDRLRQIEDLLASREYDFDLRKLGGYDNFNYEQGADSDLYRNLSSMLSKGDPHDESKVLINEYLGKLTDPERYKWVTQDKKTDMDIVKNEQAIAYHKSNIANWRAEQMDRGHNDDRARLINEAEQSIVYHEGLMRDLGQEDSEYDSKLMNAKLYQGIPELARSLSLWDPAEYIKTLPTYTSAMNNYVDMAKKKGAGRGSGWMDAMTAKGSSSIMADSYANLLNSYTSDAAYATNAIPNITSLSNSANTQAGNWLIGMNAGTQNTFIPQAIDTKVNYAQYGKDLNTDLSYWDKEQKPKDTGKGTNSNEDVYG